MPRGGRQRLHRKAPGRRKALVAGARVDAEIASEYAAASRKVDIEFRLLIEAIYQLYHYDFRDYAAASLRRRMKTALVRFECETLSQLQDRVVRDPRIFSALLDHLT